MRQAFRGDASSCSRSNHDGPKGDESLLGAGVQHFSTRRDSLQLDGLGWHRRSAAARPVRSNYSYCWIAGMVFGDAGTTVPDGARIRQHHNAASMGLWLHQRAYSMFQARGRPFPCPNLCAPCGVGIVVRFDCGRLDAGRLCSGRCRSRSQWPVDRAGSLPSRVVLDPAFVFAYFFGGGRTQPSWVRLYVTSPYGAATTRQPCSTRVLASPPVAPVSVPVPR
jgi:hypothetical protein